MDSQSQELKQEVVKRNYKVKGHIAGKLEGKVTYVHPRDRWGFIRDTKTFPDQVHFEAAACDDFDSLHVGDDVGYEIADPPDLNGPHAKRVWQVED